VWQQLVAVETTNDGQDPRHFRVAEGGVKIGDA
jgi:hypothetical protein